MSEINNERKSAGTAQKGVDEKENEKLKSGCPDATCSASSFVEDGWYITESGEKLCCVVAPLEEAHDGCKCRNQGANADNPEGVGEGLDVTACSASSFSEGGVV